MPLGKLGRISTIHRIAVALDRLHEYELERRSGSQTEYVMFADSHLVEIEPERIIAEVQILSPDWHTDRMSSVAHMLTRTPTLVRALWNVSEY